MFVVESENEEITLTLETPSHYPNHFAFHSVLSGPCSFVNPQILSLSRIILVKIRELSISLLWPISIVCSLLSHVWLCDPMDCSPPGSNVHGVLQARILEWFSISSCRDLPDPVIKPNSSVLQEDSLQSELPGKS